ncbi:MAG: ABC transporter substrate-binding protein [Terriglobia bacterium]
MKRLGATLALLLTAFGVLHNLCCTRSRVTAKRVAIFELQPAEWADALMRGFNDGLRQHGFEVGKNVIVVTKSAAGDPLGAVTLAQTLVRQDYALVFALGTQASQDIFEAANNSLPLIFGAVTDPVKAGFYDGTLQKPRKNITGTQDIWPYSAQFDLIKQLLPNVLRIGIVYNSSEVNSQVSVQLIKDQCAKRNIQLLERTVTDESQVPMAVAGLLNARIDAFFVPADNTVQSDAQVVIAACMNKDVPLFTGIPGIVENGAVGTVGTNYYELGKVNGAQAAQILSGTPGRDIPVQVAEKGDLYLNLASIKKLGLHVQEDLVKKAFKVYQ